MSKRHFETDAIRIQQDQSKFREHSVPIFMTSSFTFDDAQHGRSLFEGEDAGFLYSRFSNPNTAEFIEKMCRLERTNAGVATASGMAAVYTALVANLQSGDHLVASRDLFGNSLYIIKELLPKMGIEYSLVEVNDNSGWMRAVRTNTKLMFVETPSNPTLKIADLSYLGRLAKDRDILLIVDNTFATPYLQNPIDNGAGIVLHSCTKYIDGQGRVLGGILLGDEETIEVCYNFIRRTGASMSPFNAWVLSKSLETLAVRMDRHCSNAYKIAQYLKNHRAVLEVAYPFDEGFNQMALAKQQMTNGGGLVSFSIRGGLGAGVQFLNHLKIHSLTANLGDTRSIVAHPASTTHSKLSAEERTAIGIGDGLIRLSVGLEHVDDLIDDIGQALNFCTS